MSDGVERGVTAPMAAGAPPGVPDPSLGAPRPPLSLVGTLAWSAAAAVAGLLSAVLLIVAAIVGQRLSGTSVEPNEAAIVWTAASVGGLLFFAVIVIGCRRCGWRAADYLGLLRPKGRYVRWGLLAFLLPNALAIVIAQIGPLGEAVEPPSTLPETAAWFIGIAMVGPVAEELLFRGFLHRGLAASRLGTGGAIVLTALAWSSLHVDRTWLGSAQLLFSGVALGWLRWRSGSIVPAIAVHGVHNITSLLVSMLR